VISLKRFLDADREREEALERVIQLLLQGMILHSIEGLPEDHAMFRQSIQAILEALTQPQTPQDYLVQAGAANRSIEEYHRRTVKYFERRHTAMQTMIGMLAGAIGSIAEASEKNLSRLQEIEGQVASAAEIEDVRSIKTKLTDCLEDIRRERARQKTDASERVERLSEGLDRARGDDATGAPSKPDTQSPPVAETDSVTGLPGRVAAEAAIDRACHLQQPVSAAVIVLDSLPAINARYGRNAGDAVLQSFADSLAQKLAPEDALFRWTGPALVGLLRRPEKTEGIRKEFGRLMEQKFEYTIQTPSRAILLPIARRWAVLPMGQTPAAIFNKIDNFVSPAIGRD
jgi:diguanylate cyclase (GGDEF)-like protein